MKLAKIIMKFISSKKLLARARDNGYAVGAFNFSNMEVCQAIAEAAKEMNSPVIMQTSESAIEYAGIEYLYSIAMSALKTTKTPICLHVDHAHHFETIKKSIDIGYSSVMIDVSKLPYEENIKISRKVADYAHKYKVSVEAEFGVIPGIEDVKTQAKTIMLTDPEIALDFVKRTKCDSFAPSIGTAHGGFMALPKLDFKRLKELRETLDVPLVLHGSSGVSDADLKKAISLGISKINIDTQLQLAFDEAVRKFYQENPKQIKEDKKTFDPRHYLGPAREAVKENVIRHIKIFGSENKA